jgi:hypothetical protein
MLAYRICTLCQCHRKKFNLPTADLLDLSHEHDPSAAARTLRQRWAIGERPIGNMVKLLETKGVRVFSLAENTKNVDAFSCWRNDEPYVFLNTFKSTERSRFDAAHGAGRRLNWQSCRLAREQLRQLGEVRGEWRECGASRQSEVKPDGESQSVGCSTLAAEARADKRCCGQRLVPRRSLQCLIGDFVAK